MGVTNRIKKDIPCPIVFLTLFVALLLGAVTPARAAAQTLFTTQVPAQVSQSDGANVKYELGTVFQSNAAGQVSAIRFWKDVKETGTHTGHLWSASGQLLASVVFASETASGWQQQALAAPLAIAANTAYVVSVNTGQTYYVATTSGLVSKVTNGNLSSVVGKNGAYGTTGTFPTNSWNASNYFRDVVFVTTGTTIVPPAITTQPSSQTIASGQTATFNVAATGTAPMAYQWKNGTTAISGATSSTYTTPAETSNQTFSVTVTNSVGSATSNAATLTVNAAAVAPTITTQPASQTIASGQTATFNVAATGTAPMTYQWKNGTTAISGATSSTYTTPAETSNQTFSVTVANGAGSATSNVATLTVSTKAVAPTITTQPASKTITSGQTATFSVVATGTAPMTYQWKNGTTSISGATSSTYTTPAESSNQSFSVTVTNSMGSATSNAATLTVTPTTALLNTSATSLSFGNVNLSSSSAQNVTFTNAGNSNVTISGVSIINGAGFNPSGVSSGLILTPGQTAQMTVTFAPAAIGIVTGTIQVSSNATNSPDKITLSGTGIAAVSHSVSLSWAASTSSVTGYNVYSSNVSGGPYTKLNTTLISTTAFTDTAVQAGQTYYFVVTAVNAQNVESAYSSQVSAIVP